MNRLYITGACLLLIVSLCTELSNGATTASPSATTETNSEATTQAATSPKPTATTTTVGVTDVVLDALNNATKCPRFTSRLENNTLYMAYVADSCEMVVTVENVLLPRPNQFRRKPRAIRRPVVSFRPMGIEPASCESLPNRSLGPFVFVDTVMDECQMLIKIQKQKNPDFVPKIRPGKRGRGQPREPRFLFVPTYEYLDEMVY
ncbi:uncharacterized protein [Argopecten irradians]|uniref:uncharacterized protein n=1 Tax=Argopecten irradians TaxID=31199 RepID=UPI00371C90B7